MSRLGWSGHDRSRAFLASVPERASAGGRQRRGATRRESAPHPVAAEFLPPPRQPARQRSTEVGGARLEDRSPHPPFLHVPGPVSGVGKDDLAALMRRLRPFGQMAKLHGRNAGRRAVQKEGALDPGARQLRRRAKAKRQRVRCRRLEREAVVRPEPSGQQKPRRGGEVSNLAAFELFGPPGRFERRRVHEGERRPFQHQRVRDEALEVQIPVHFAEVGHHVERARVAAFPRGRAKRGPGKRGVHQVPSGPQRLARGLRGNGANGLGRDRHARQLDRLGGQPQHELRPAPVQRQLLAARPIRSTTSVNGGEPVSKTSKLPERPVSRRSRSTPRPSKTATMASPTGSPVEASTSRPLAASCPATGKAAPTSSAANDHAGRRATVSPLGPRPTAPARSSTTPKRPGSRPWPVPARSSGRRRRSSRRKTRTGRRRRW